MNKRENYVVERVDRSRERQDVRQARTARAVFLRMKARRIVQQVLSDIVEPKEQAVILGDLIDIAAEYRAPLIGEVETATALTVTAGHVCADFRVNAAVKSAAAEQQWSRLTAANDGGGDD